MSGKLHHRGRPIHATIPRAYLRDKSVSASAKTLWTLLDDYTSPDGPAPFPGQKTLGGYLGVSERTIYSWLQELVDAGWLEIEAKPGKTNDHILVWPAPDYEPRKSASGVGRKSASGVPRKPASDEEEPGEEEPVKKAGSAPEVAATSRARAADAAASEQEPRTVMAMVLARLDIDRDPSASETRMTAKALANGWTLDDLLDRAADGSEQGHDPYAWVMRALGAMATSEPTWGPQLPPPDRTSPPVPDDEETRAAAAAEYWERVRDDT